MTKQEHVKLIEIAGRLEEIHESLGRITSTIDNRFVQELLYREVVLIEGIVRDILLSRDAKSNCH